MSYFRMPDLIMKKRDGYELSKEEIDFFIRSVCDNKNNNQIQESQIGVYISSSYYFYCYFIFNYDFCDSHILFLSNF
jgi:thymidine phosphorylase